MRSPDPAPAAPLYEIVAPMQIGTVSAMTRALDLSRVVFESPSAFAVGASIDFSILIRSAGAPVQMTCSGVIVRCTPLAATRFEAAVTIDTLDIAKEDIARQRA